MKNLAFLNKIGREGKLKTAEPSLEISLSYLQKSENCLKSASLLFENRLYENATAEAYYSMYNALLSLLFKIGIQSENHTASILLLKEFLDEPKLYDTLIFAKEERIDKQYYVTSQQTIKANYDSCKDMLRKAEDVLVQIKLVIDGMSNEKSIAIRKKLLQLLPL